MAWMQVQSSAACWLMAACFGTRQETTKFSAGTTAAPTEVVASQKARGVSTGGGAQSSSLRDHRGWRGQRLGGESFACSLFRCRLALLPSSSPAPWKASDETTGSCGSPVTSSLGPIILGGATWVYCVARSSLWYAARQPARTVLVPQLYALVPAA